MNLLKPCFLYKSKIIVSFTVMYRWHSQDKNKWVKGKVSLRDRGLKE